MRALSFTGIAVAFGGLLALGGMLAPKDAVRAMVAGPGAATAVAIEGDTFLLSGERIKLVGVDAPEWRGPRCESELQLALRAKQRLAALLAEGRLKVERQGKDIYGDTMAHVSVDGRDIGATMLDEGLALPYQRGSAAKLSRLAEWCGSSASVQAPARS